MGIFGKKYCKKGHKIDPSWDCCPVCIAPIMGWFVSYVDGRALEVYDVHLGRNLIGKGEDCEIRIMLDSIIRHHALLVSKDDECSIVSQGAKGHLRVNGNHVSSTILIDGDLVTIGNHEYKFKSI